MLTVLAVLAALAVLFAAGVLITHEGDVLRDAPADAPDLDLPIGPLQPEDVPQLRFGLALRGYRMDEVDTALARLALELADRDRQLHDLTQALASAQADKATAEDERTQAWPAWPETTSAVAETPDAVHAPVPELFPEIVLPEPLPSSFGMYDREPPAPLGPPGVGFAASGGGAPDPAGDSGA